MGARVSRGAGFSRCPVARAFLESGHEVQRLDSLIEPVRRSGVRNPILRETERNRAGVWNLDRVTVAPQGRDHGIDRAAEVRADKTMDEVNRYGSVNDHETAVLVQAPIDRPVPCPGTARLTDPPSPPCANRASARTVHAGLRVSA